MSKALSIKTLIISIVFSAFTMSAMLMYSANKMVVIANSAANYVQDEDEIVNIEVLELMSTASDDTAFTLKVPAGLKAEAVIVENKYLERELWVYLDRAEMKDFETNCVEGNTTPVLSAYLQEVRGGTWVKFQMKGLFEYITTLENGVLSISAKKPKEVYERVLVLDCDRSATCATLINDLRDELEADGAKVYLVNEITDEYAVKKKMTIARDAQADFYLKLQLETSPDTSLYGINSYYNEEFFTPTLDGAVLADNIERNLVLNLYNTGFTPQAGSDKYEELSKAPLPAVVLTVGYLSNPQEALLLNKDSYRNRIVEGIRNGIYEVYAGSDY